MGNQTMTVVGGGLLGAAIAYGAARAGLRVHLLDQGDAAFRASRGNFGLVWVQSKGAKQPRYARWSRDGAQLWPKLQQELLDLTGVDAGLRQVGGFWLGFSDADMTARETVLERLDEKAGGIPFRIMDHAELKHYLPGIGPAVVGGSFCPLDGHANPLMLLRALHAGLRLKGADVITGVDIAEIRYDPGLGRFDTFAKDGQHWQSERIVLAAGLGNEHLAPQVGLNAPVVPKRGQVLITERLKPFLEYPTNKCRQTNEGSIQIGSSSEDVGFDDGTTTDVVERLARRAVETFPALSQARMVRAWGALRPLSPDGLPIYEQSTACPGAYVATSHSGVSLAAAHSFVLAPWMCGLADAPPEFDVFSGARFGDPNASFSNDH